MVADMRSGVDWAHAVRDALSNSDQALFLVTPNYVRKPWFYMEWAGVWIQEKPAHVLLFNVTLADLPEVMRQAEIIDVNHLDHVAQLLAAISGLGQDDPGLTALAERLLSFGKGSRASWDEARWESICRSVETGTAILSSEDLTWVLESGRAERFVEFLRTNFAHPTLMQQVATLLSRSNFAELAVHLGEMLDGASQARLFRSLVEEGHEESAVALGSHVGTSESRRQIAEFALQNELTGLVVRIGEEFDQGRDKRAIAIALLQAGHLDEAVQVMADVDTNYDRRRFALECIKRGEIDLAVEQATEMTVGREIRLLAVAIRETGQGTKAVEVVSRIDKNTERQNFCRDAIRAGEPDLAVAVASTMTVGAELRKVATALFSEGYRAEALGVVKRIKLSAEKRAFAEDCLSAGDREAILEVASSMDLSSDKRLLAELLADVSLDDEAIAVAGMIDVDDEAVSLFWAAASRSKWELASHALRLVRNGERSAGLLRDLHERIAALGA